jgi:hypothetical protein
MTKFTDMDNDLLKERYRLSHHGWFYAIQRIDLLIIAISGAGVYVGLEVLKFSIDHKLDLLWMIKSSGITLVLAISLNLISQMTGKKANRYDMIMCDYKLHLDNESSQSDICKVERYDDLSERYSGYTRTLNILSLIFMGIGLLTLIIFFAIIF